MVPDEETKEGLQVLTKTQEILIISGSLVKGFD